MCFGFVINPLSEIPASSLNSGNSNCPNQFYYLQTLQSVASSQ